LKQNKLITNLFKGKEIRSIWNSDEEDYYFSVVDVISVLTDSNIPKRYWADLKRNLINEGSQLYENIVRLKFKASDGKMRETDTLNTKGIFRLIESVPSKNAEPFKLWLADLGKERIDEVFNPELAINRAITYYRNKSYPDSWIEARLKGILNRNKLTDVWKENGITENYEYAILTNEIYKGWSGMTAKEYKEFKHLRKESLRDNMTDLEILLADIGEVTTRELTKAHNPYGFNENKHIAYIGGNIAKNTRNDIENNLGKSIVTNENNLNYKYIENEMVLDK
jgi:hypothetical protein